MCSVYHSPFISSLLGPTISLSTLFSNTHNLSTFCKVRDEVSHMYKPTSKINTLQNFI